MAATITYVPQGGTPYFFQISGTGTALDGQKVGGVVVIDGSTGLPASFAAAGAAASSGSYHLDTTAGLNAAEVKAGASVLFGWQAFNTTSAPRFLKLYNKASAPLVASDVPALTVGVPPYQSVVYASPVGIAFPLGIAMAVTSGPTDTDTTPVAAGDLILNLEYR